MTFKSLLETSLYFFWDHGAVEILRKLMFSGPGSGPGETSILMSLLMLQRRSKRSGTWVTQVICTYIVVYLHMCVIT